MKKAETVTDRKEVIFDAYTVNADQKTDGYGQIYDFNFINVRVQ